MQLSKLSTECAHACFCPLKRSVSRRWGSPSVNHLCRRSVQASLRCRRGVLYGSERKRELFGRAAASESETKDQRIPVTVITGFLGSGKTTLLNHILTNEHGLRIAIVENEFGEIDIDSSLITRQECLGGYGGSVMYLNNGCLCCTVREDLIKSLNALYERKNEFDHIVIETTGLANPAPIITTFYRDPTLPDKVRLDGVVTVVDAKHVRYHLDKEKNASDGNEALEQIAYADRIILNKTDLVEEQVLTDLEDRISNINTMARVRRGQHAVVPVDYVLGVGGFDLGRIGEQVLPAKTTNEVDSEEGHHHHHHGHEHSHSDSHGDHHHHGHEHDHSGSSGNHHHHHHHDHDPYDHQHDDEVQSINLEVEGNMDLDKINFVLGGLVQAWGKELYRMKGVLSVEGRDERFVFQGVHMMFDGAPNREWGVDEKRTSKIVFIGKNLPQKDFEDAFRSCLA